MDILDICDHCARVAYCEKLGTYDCPDHLHEFEGTGYEL